jgi:MOSC domain-containing protein YiiM
MMKMISLNVGLPAQRRFGDQQYYTGSLKQPVPAAMLHATNFEGDGQGDLKNHGGVDKAVCVYAAEHYPYWEQRLGQPLSPGAFSENLTVSGALETAVCIGDIFQIGEALVQVSQPRQPCAKQAAKLGRAELLEWMIETGFSGFYLRVLRPGLVSAGDAFELRQEHPARISIAMVFAELYDQARNRTVVAQLATLPEFSDYGRRKFSERLKKLQ